MGCVEPGSKERDSTITHRTGGIERRTYRNILELCFFIEMMAYLYLKVSFLCFLDSIDWKKPGAEKIVKRVTGKVKNGSIVLFHSGAPDTPTALPQILEYLKKEGYEFVTVGSLIYEAPYTLDHEGRQHKSS